MTQGPPNDPNKRPQPRGNEEAHLPQGGLSSDMSTGEDDSASAVAQNVPTLAAASPEDREMNDGESCSPLIDSDGLARETWRKLDNSHYRYWVMRDVLEAINGELNERDMSRLATETLMTMRLDILRQLRVEDEYQMNCVSAINYVYEERKNVSKEAAAESNPEEPLPVADEVEGSPGQPQESPQDRSSGLPQDPILADVHGMSQPSPQAVQIPALNSDAHRAAPTISPPPAPEYSAERELMNAIPFMSLPAHFSEKIEAMLVDAIAEEYGQGLSGQRSPGRTDETVKASSHGSSLEGATPGAIQRLHDMLLRFQERDPS